MSLNSFYMVLCFSLHPLFPGSNEVDQIAKIHDIMGTPDPNVLNKLRKWVLSGSSEKVASFVLCISKMKSKLHV